MNKKCVGCGSILQTIDETKEGYIPEKKYLDSSYCQRCFKTINYKESFIVNKNVDIEDFTNKVNKNNNPVLYVIDALTISKTTLNIISKFKTNLYVVITKRDLLPKSIKDSKLINYIKDATGVSNVFVVSSKNKYNIDFLYKTLVKNNEKKLYVCGYSNAGKSALINSLIESVGKSSTITVSSSLNTTLEEMTVKLDDNISLIDTPGFVNVSSIANFIDMKKYINLFPKKEIKPKIHLLKPGFMILLNDIRIENNTEKAFRLSFYLGENVKLEKLRIERRNNYKNYEKINISATPMDDIVIEGIGFIKVIDECQLVIYSVNKCVISKRRKMV